MYKNYANKKVLLVLDLNGLLGYKQHTKYLKEEFKGMEFINPHKEINKYGLYYRPNSEVLLKI